MKQHKRAAYLCACFLLYTFTAQGQRYFGVATSDWNTINALYLNPANIAGCKEKISISIFSANVGVDNNLGTFSLSNIGNALNSSGSGQSTFNNQGRSTFSMLVPAAEVRGPGVLIKINDRSSIAITTRLRVINQLNNFNQSLFSTITSPNFVAGNTYTIKAQSFNWTAHLWSELGITYGAIIAQNDNSQLKAGLTLRYLGGIGYLGLKGNNLDLNFNTGKDSFYAYNSDLQYTSNIISTHNAVFNGISASSLLGNFFGSSQGSGLGADAGIVYSFSPGAHDQYSEKESTPAYKLRISASVTDAGSISYKANNNSTVNVTGNGYLTGKGLSDNTKNATDFKNYIVSQGFTGDTASQATKIYLPTALLLGADYEVYDKIYVNGTYINNLANRGSFGNSFYNQVTITPRYDTKLFTVGLPITYSMLANDLKMGLGLRIGGFFLGSDDMLALFSKSQYGFNFYFGGYVPLFTHGNRDTNQ